MEFNRINFVAQQAAALNKPVQKEDAKAEEKKEEVAAPLDEEIKMMIEQRNEARKNKDYALADRIRNELKEKGVMIEDTAEGTKYKLI